ncbi:acyl-CoA oxidase [Prauserella shujinwangii]|uniref:Acyl-CoA oxidase n=1 Tax=Prauserella shujinwangii TaxID=1453103 RepID=A0A2T0M3Y1_9PSEU|nr:hypothetical protein [Prauserella shujinwangii]PRX51461.1 acyl-CoA oxidase [Prauserella shujinwangii]
MTFPSSLRERMSVWAELDALLGRPEFDHARTGINATYERLRAFGHLLGPARRLYHDPARLLAGIEWAGIVDPPLMHVAMVHFGVATTAIVECGRSGHDLDTLTAQLDTMAAPGAIVATELGRGGSQVSLRTEARYDRERGTFTLHTPDDAALKIMPNVGWTALPRTAVVAARLVTGGTEHGVHAFAFRFPHPRARVVPLPGGAPLPLDYAVIRFEHAEIPFGHWLRDDATLTDGMVVDPLPPQRRLARTLGGVNAAVTSAAVALASAARATVAITARYTRQRLIGDPGVPALGFPAHRAELASAIARVYALGCYVDKVSRDFVAERTGTGRTTPAADAGDAGYAPWLAADRDRTLAKAAATTTLESVAARCRRLCGFQGVLHTNRITGYEDMARSFHAAGGDTRLLLLEAGKQLVDGTDAPAGHGAPGHDPGDPRSVLRLVCLHERVLANRLRRHADHAGLDDRLDQVERLAHVHIVRRTLQESGAAEAAAPGPWRTTLGAARRLYAIDALLDSAAWHLDHGSLRPGDVDVLRQARSAAAEHVIRHLDAFVDGLAVPPGRVGGFIGRADYIDRIAALTR